NPQFTTRSEGWRITRRADETELRAVTGPSSKGVHAWTELPKPLDAGKSYELTIAWTPRTASRAINLHLRNPRNGEFRVIGSVRVSSRSGEPREDRVRFRTDDAEFSQLMIGALHFTGADAGAVVRSIALKEVAGAPGAPAKPE